MPNNQECFVLVEKGCHHEKFQMALFLFSVFCFNQGCTNSNIKAELPYLFSHSFVSTSAVQLFSQKKAMPKQNSFVSFLIILFQSGFFDFFSKNGNTKAESLCFFFNYKFQPGLFDIFS